MFSLNISSCGLCSLASLPPLPALRALDVCGNRISSLYVDLIEPLRRAAPQVATLTLNANPCCYRRWQLRAERASAAAASSSSSLEFAIVDLGVPVDAFLFDLESMCAAVVAHCVSTLSRVNGRRRSELAALCVVEHSSAEESSLDAVAHRDKRIKL